MNILNVVHQIITLQSNDNQSKRKLSDRDSSYDQDDADEGTYAKGKKK